MEERKGEYCEQGFLPVPLLISASCSSSGKQEQQWPRTPRRCPHEALQVCYRIKSFYLLVFICIFFFKKCGLGQCSKTTVTQTGGRNDRTERPRRRAKGHLRKNTYQKDVGVFACYEQIKRGFFFSSLLIMLCFIPVSFCVVLNFDFFSGCHFAFAGF